jgi:hypothetical protein
LIEGDRRILLQQSTSDGHFIQPLLLRMRFIGLTTFAWAKTRSNSAIGIREETHILTQGVARATGRAAEDAGGQHCKNKLAIRLRIARQHRLPALFIK